MFVCIILGDHKLSYREFIAVMKGWKLRGYKVMDNVCVREKSSSLLSSFSPSLSLSSDERKEATGRSARRVQGLCQDGNEGQIDTTY